MAVFSRGGLAGEPLRVASHASRGGMSGEGVSWGEKPTQLRLGVDRPMGGLLRQLQFGLARVHEKQGVQHLSRGWGHEPEDSKEARGVSHVNHMDPGSHANIRNLHLES